MYEFYEEPRHLNLKKVIIISVVLLVILLLIILFIAKKISTPKDNTEPQTQATQNTTTTFSSNDNSVRVELSNHLNLMKYESNYLLELRSENNLGIFISKKDAISNRELSDIVNADKIAFLQNFEKSSNISDIKELSVNNNLAYTYSFHYLDTKLNKAFYLQIAWLQIDNQYYVFDIEFPLDDLSFYTNLVTSVLASFSIQ